MFKHFKLTLEMAKLNIKLKLKHRFTNKILHTIHSSGEAVHKEH